MEVKTLVIFTVLLGAVVTFVPSAEAFGGNLRAQEPFGKRQNIFSGQVCELGFSLQLWSPKIHSSLKISPSRMIVTRQLHLQHYNILLNSSMKKVYRLIIGCTTQLRRVNGISHLRMNVASNNPI